MTADDPHTPASNGPSGHTDAARSDSADLARELTGDLPCIACGYNLRSISVLGVCPECATPVRATILARVDPYAGVLRPITSPRLTAAALMLWSSAALAAALVIWSLRIADALEIVSNITIDTGSLVIAGLALIALSGLGALLALLRPHSGISPRQVLLAAGAIAAYIPLLWMYWQLHAVYDPPRVRPYLDNLAADSQRALLRIAAGALMLIIVVGLRPNLRLLTARSLLLRMGRADRQTMLGLAAAISVALLGDLLHLLASDLSPQPAHVAFLLGILLIAVGSMLITVGLVGIVIDCIRILPVILRPPISYRQVLGDQARRTDPERP